MGEKGSWYGKKEVDTEEKLKATNDLLLQKDREWESEWQKAKVERAELEKKLREEIIGLEDAGYAIFKEGFDEAIAKVKYFNNDVLIKFSKVDQEKKLDEILGQQP